MLALCCARCSSALATKADLLIGPRPAQLPPTVWAFDFETLETDVDAFCATSPGTDEPVARFVSGVMYYARGRERAALRRRPPAQLTRDHFEGWLKPRYSISRGYDFDSYEYTLVMSGMLAPHFSGTSRRLAERTRVARRNLERWVDAVGVTEAMDAFVVLMAFTLGWPPHAFGCYSLRNVGPPAPTRHANQSVRAERRVAASELNPRVRSWLHERLRNEIEVRARAMSAP